MFVSYLQTVEEVAAVLAGCSYCKLCLRDALHWQNKAYFLLDSVMLRMRGKKLSNDARNCALPTRSMYEVCSVVQHFYRDLRLKKFEFLPIICNEIQTQIKQILKISRHFNSLENSVWQCLNNKYEFNCNSNLRPHWRFIDLWRLKFANSKRRKSFGTVVALNSSISNDIWKR